MPDHLDVERAALVALLRERPKRLTWPQIAVEAGQRGSSLALWDELNPADLFSDGAGSRAVAKALADLAEWRAGGLGFLTFFDEEYPAQLRDVHEIPPVIFYRGTLVPDEAAVSVVGSRSASMRGLEIARNVATELANRGLAVISGLARGIDTAAHAAALSASGRTIAVLGCGITRYYPAENRELQDRIAREGLVISQFWPDAAPRQQQFPMRNAIISGYGLATVVVEAGEKSGARIQARQSIAHGRPVILTNIVVEANDWARQLVGRPGVYVAGSTAEVVKLVEDVMVASSEIDELLSAVRE